MLKMELVGDEDAIWATGVRVIERSFLDRRRGVNGPMRHIEPKSVRWMEGELGLVLFDPPRLLILCCVDEFPAVC